jgi:hypothetical protein
VWGRGHLKNQVEFTVNKLFITQFVVCSVSTYKYIQHHREITVWQLTKWTHQQNITQPKKHNAALTCSSQQTSRILPWSKACSVQVLLFTNCFRLLKQRHNVCYSQGKKHNEFGTYFLPGLTDKSRHFLMESTQLTKYSNRTVESWMKLGADS